MIYKYRDRDFTGINGHMFAHKGTSGDSTPYFYIEDISGQSNTLSIVKSNSPAPTLTIEKSMDGKNWTVLGTTSTTAITATIPANGKLYLRCSTNSWAFTDMYGFQYNHISVSNHCSIGGNIMSLLYGAQFTGNETVFPSGQGEVFRWLFGSCDTIIRADALVLPVIELTEYCYAEMFMGCTSLNTAPTLPATTLAEGCYQYMFYGCRALPTAPVLPATTLTNYCYRGMFDGCASLTTAPVLPATTLTEGCYQYMFYGCRALPTAPELPATTLAEGCYQYMFKDCTSLPTAPELPATTLANYCYRGMFGSCTALTTAPVLPATTLADNCYDSMFNGCTSLTIAPVLPATTLTEGCYQFMFNGCTSLTTAPELPATTLANYCYRGMFYGCTSLSEVKCLATDISASNCLHWWVRDVAGSGTFYKKDGVEWPTGTNGIPEGWTVKNV